MKLVTNTSYGLIFFCKFKFALVKVLAKFIMKKMWTWFRQFKTYIFQLMKKDKDYSLSYTQFLSQQWTKTHEVFPAAKVWAKSCPKVKTNYNAAYNLIGTIILSIMMSYTRRLFCYPNKVDLKTHIVSGNLYNIVQTTKKLCMCQHVIKPYINIYHTHVRYERTCKHAGKNKDTS